MASSPARPPLTHRSEEILTFIRSYLDRNGWAPTVREICAAVEINSTSVMHSELRRLEYQGYLSRGEGVSRGIRLIP